MIQQNKFVLFLYFVALNLPLNLVRSDVFLSRGDDVSGNGHLGAASTLAPAASPKSVSDVAPSAVPVGDDGASRQSQLHSGNDAKSALSSIVGTTTAPLHHLIGSGINSGSASVPSVAPAAALHHSLPHLTSAPVVHADGHEPKDPLHRFCDYLRPICDSIDKIQAKQLTKIQSEFKQFIQLTGGKLSSCFSDHFGFDPATKSLALADVKTVCASKHLAPAIKGSYKSFEGCALKNWDTALDKELDRINEARLNFLKNHNHAKNDSHSDHDDDLALISEVVSQVLNSDKSVVNNSDIKVIDISSHSGKPVATGAPVISSVKPAVSAPPSKMNSILNDPNTLLVFVDDSKTTLAPAHPLPAHLSTVHPSAVHLSTVHPSTVHLPTVIPSTVHPLLGHSAPAAPAVAAIHEAVSSHPTVKASVPVALPTTTTHPLNHVSIPPTGKQLNLPGQPITTAAPLKAKEAPKEVIVKEKAHEAVKEAVKAGAKDPVKLHEVAKEAVSEVKTSSLAHKVVPSVAPSTAPVAKSLSSSSAPIIPHLADVTTFRPTIISITSKKPLAPVPATKIATPSTLDAHLKPTVKALVLSTVKPSALPVKAKLALSVAPSVAPKVGAAKPFDTLEEILRRQEKEKQDLETKLRLEREKVLKQLQKKQDEIDAQNAIKSLQIQRDITSGQTSDAKLHQLEHERQMSIDPVGHQLKHQQYELNKQKLINKA